MDKEETIRLLDTAEKNKNEKAEQEEMQRCTITSSEVTMEKATLLSITNPAVDDEISPSVFEEEVQDEGKDIPSEIPPISSQKPDEHTKDIKDTADKTAGRKRSKEGKPHVSLQLDIKAAHEYGEKRNSKKLVFKHQTPGTADPSKPIKVQVFLKEGEGKLLTLEKGKLTSAGEIKTMMLEVLSIPKTAGRLFAIWLISPYLELQLKGHHIPYLLRKEWRDMLINFSSCKDQVLASNDEPVLVFQRNSFCLIKHEERENEETVIKRLYAEARDNILNAKYPIPTDDAIMLGGILARIELGPYTPEFKAGYLRKHLTNLLPFYAIGSNKIIQQVRSSGVEQLLREQHDHATKKTNDVISCQRKFIEYCRTLPFYGCAFFRGKVLQDHTSWKVWKSCEKEVVVGINRNGITIFKANKQENIIYLPYDDVSWEYLKEEGETDALCIEYDVLDAEGQAIPQQIQIITKQSCMMDAMIDSCVNSLNAMNVPKTPTSADYSKLMDLSMRSYFFWKPLNQNNSKRPPNTNSPKEKHLPLATFV